MQLLTTTNQRKEPIMIVLSRKSLDIGTPEGRIYVGGDIAIHLSGLDSGKVRIGISAPKDVLIFRG